MAHKLDRYYPHCRVYGHPVVKWEQSGRYFDNDGKEVDVEGKPVKDSTLHLVKKKCSTS